jgi:hypothetical protein
MTPATPVARPKRVSWRNYGIALVIIIAFSFLPFASALIAEAIARANGCNAAPISSSPCMIGGLDWSGMLSWMDYLIFSIVYTVPAGAICFLVWLIVLIVQCIRDGRN